MQAIVTVPFHGDTIITIETQDGIYVPIKPLCERFGVALTNQIVKLKARPERWGVMNIITPTTSGAQEMACLPMRKIAGWLTTINVAKVKPEAREALTLYQNEADDVLDRHFRLRERERADYLQEAEARAEKLRLMTLSGNALWNRIARLQEAGCSLTALPAVLRRSSAEVDRILDMMEDMDLIEARNWTGLRPARDFMAPVKPLQPLDEAIQSSM